MSSPSAPALTYTLPSSAVLIVNASTVTLPVTGITIFNALYDKSPLISPAPRITISKFNPIFIVFDESANTVKPSLLNDSPTVISLPVRLSNVHS